MKILQIHTVCGTTSPGRIATDIHHILQEQGHESYIAYGRGEALNCEDVIKIGDDFDNYVHVALTRILDKHGFGSVKATKDFIKEIEKLNPDLIHLHNVHGYYLNIEILFNYLKKVKKPVVWTLHDCWSLTGHCSHFDYAGCNRWKSECHNCPEKKMYPSSIIFDNSKTNYYKKKRDFTGIENLTIITPSQWLGKLVKESYMKDYPVKVINNGVDLSIFKPNKSNFKKKFKLEDKFIILGVASVWTERKGLNCFFEISSQLKEDEIIVLVGLSEKQEQKLPNNILAISKTNSIQELSDIYNSADVFVNPTLEDTFPTTNLEAMACGTPVITFDTGGSPESIVDETGIIVKREDVVGMLGAIKKIKNTGKATFVDECRKNALAKYSKEDRYQEYIRLYKEMIEREMK